VRIVHLLAAGTAGTVAMTSLAACGGGVAKTTDAARNGKIAVVATDSECKVARTAAGAGTVHFTVTNQGSKVTEFYVYAAGDRVMGEVENIAPGVTRELLVELGAGAYETTCKPGMVGKGLRVAFTVSGVAPSADNATELAAAGASYQRYVRGQTGALIDKTTEFVSAIKGGDAEKAKALYPVARTYWERIEPVAQVFGNLDPSTDGREDTVEAGQEFTGFHRLEKDLWQAKDISTSGPIADRLLADVRLIVDKANTATMTPVQLANGAKELLDEVATGKITGEEDRYSHTDMWDFAANVEGSKAAVASLRPILERTDPTLVTTLDGRFAAVASALDKHRRGDGWQYHNELSQDELKALADAINALAEPVSKVAATVATR
jgi:iron uptake system component EfeO